MAGFGPDRLARRLLEQAQSLAVPTLEEPTDIGVQTSRLEFARAAGVEPDLWQVAVLESAARKHILLCSRQAGKSTVAALLADHEAVSVPGSLVLVLSPSLRQSSELFRTCMRHMQEAAQVISLPGIVAESVLRCELENGSRIIALPGSEATTRGYSAATLVIVDEASRVPDALIAAVRPTLATTNGRIIALSTPAGRRGWFYLEWTNGQGWERTEIKADDCPRISKEFLEDEKRSLGPFIYEQEYCCLFHDSDTAVFSSELIERALTDEVTPLWGTAI